MHCGKPFMNSLFIILGEKPSSARKPANRSGDDGGYDWTCRASSAFGRIVKLLPSTSSVNGCCLRRQIGELNTLLAPAPTERAEFTLCGPANSLVRLQRTCICLRILSQVTSYLIFPRTCDPDLSIPIFEPYALSAPKQKARRQCRAKLLNLNGTDRSRTDDLLRVKQVLTAYIIGSHRFDPIPHPSIPSHLAKIVHKIVHIGAGVRIARYQCAQLRGPPNGLVSPIG